MAKQAQPVDIERHMRQFELFSSDNRQVQATAKYIQEPLELLLAKKINSWSLFHRRVYWCVLSKVNSLQLFTQEAIVVPATNPVINIHISELYPAQQAHLAASVAAGVPEINAVADSVEGSSAVTGLAKSNHLGKRKGTAMTARMTNYSYFKKLSEEIVQYSIISIDHMTSMDPKRRLVGSMNIFPRVLYSDGILSVEVDRMLVPTLCKLDLGYTKFNRNDALFLGRTASQILFVQLCRLLSFKKWSVTPEDLMKLLEATSYTRFSNFNQRVFKPALNDINKFTSIEVLVHEIKIGGKVVRLDFEFYSKETKPQHEQQQLRKAIAEELRTYGSQPLEVRQRMVKDTLAREYTFTAAQRTQILNDEYLLNEFLKIHLLILDGLAIVKTTPTRYIAGTLFKQNKGHQGGLF